MDATRTMDPGVDVDLDMSDASVLLVDDRPSNLLALEAVLEPLGARVVTANSGEEALKHILHEDFALILMDVQMPNLDGIQTAALIQSRERSRHIPIIFITAISKEPMHIFAGYAHGGVDYLVKPFNDEILRKKVSIFLQLYLNQVRVKRQAEMLRDRERELTERRLEARFRWLVEAMPHCIWAARPQGEVYYWNQPWVDYTGFKPAEIEGWGYLNAIHPDDREGLREKWGRAVSTSEPFELDFRVQRSGGRGYRWNMGRFVPEHAEGGALSGWIATVTDIHDHRIAEEERALLLSREQSARAAAESANRMKDEFLATVSHELRNPLQSMLGWTRMLRSTSPDAAKLARGLETIERNAQAQAELIEDILDVSRIITGKLRIDPQPLSLCAVIQAAIDSVRPAIEGKGLVLDTMLDADADRSWGDGDRIQQVVWNLLSNAIKFTPKGGTISVALQRTSSHTEIVISDTGRGITTEFIPHVFERFRQADGTTTRAHGGLGLGLAIVRHLVELHGGSVSVESPGLDRGARFTVKLPVQAVALPAKEADPRVPTSRKAMPLDQMPSLSGLKVLIVDDERDARELIAAVLESCGAAVTAVSSAEEALEALRGGPRPDVLVSDIGMPREDGYSLMERVRRWEQSPAPTPATVDGAIPAVALTGFARSDDAKRALEVGFQRHVAKPVDPGELIMHIATLAKRA